jgi:hypothetical protein
MPAGVAALERLGLNGEKGAPFNGVAITSASALRKVASQRRAE